MEVWISYVLMGIGCFTIIGSMFAAGEIAWMASLRYPADDSRSDRAFKRTFWCVAVPGAVLGLTALIAAPCMLTF